MILYNVVDVKSAQQKPTKQNYVFHLFFVAVDPVVQGKTRAEQFYRGDAQGKTVRINHISIP